MEDQKELKKQIGKRIKKSRIAAGLTQEKLADFIEIETQSMSELERGVYGPSLETLIRICKTLHVSSDYLLMGQEKSTDVPNSYHNLKYLSEKEKELLDRGINLILEAMANKK